MKVLFSADLHGRTAAFERFAALLQQPELTCGVIAGDLKDDFVPKEEAVVQLGLEPDETLDELYPADNTPRENLQMSPPEWLERSLRAAEAHLKSVLNRANKPVFLVMGNHDKVEWDDSEQVLNIHLRRVEVGSLNVVGYRYTTIEKPEAEIERELAVIERLIDTKTILVTHQPPEGTLDGGAIGEPNGSLSIRDLVARRKPAWHLFGHVHSQFGWTARAVNGAYPHAEKFLVIDTDSCTVEEIS